MNMKFSIIIPNYNGEELLRENLPNVLKMYPGVEIIVVDDASTDGSVSILEKYAPRIHAIVKKKNEGFSSAVNAGVRAAKNPLVLLLNSDACPTAHFMNTVLPYFEDGRLFAVGFAQECREDGKEIVRGRGLGAFSRGFLIHQYAKPDATSTLWVSGGAGIFRKDIWETLGGMQEIYNPFYWEDIDLSYRAVKAGYRILFEPNARVAHRQSTGSIRKSFSEDRIKTIAYRNQFFFVWLNVTDPDYLLKHLAWLPVHVFKALLSGDWAFLKGLSDAVLQFSGILKRRGENTKYWVKNDNEILGGG